MAHRRGKALFNHFWKSKNGAHLGSSVGFPISSKDSDAICYQVKFFNTTVISTKDPETTHHSLTQQMRRRIPIPLLQLELDLRIKRFRLSRAFRSKSFELDCGQLSRRGKEAGDGGGEDGEDGDELEVEPAAGGGGFGG